jgi:YVTN family beta-propeller protein
MSPDRKWVYVLDRGRISKKPGESRPSVIHVINLDTAQVAADYPAGYLAHGLRSDRETNSVVLMARASSTDTAGRVFRFHAADAPQAFETGSGLRYLRRSLVDPGLFALSHEDLRFLPDSGTPSSTVIPLNPKSKDSAALALGGFPGDAIYLPHSRKIVMTVRTSEGIPTSKVAVVNLTENRLERVVTTGRGSVKFAKYAGAIALSATATGLSYYSNSVFAQGNRGSYFFYNAYTFPLGPHNLELASSSDGQFVYALNTLSNDVTVIEVRDGSVLQKIPVGGGCRQLASAPGGRFVYSFTTRQLDLIDTQTNQKWLEYHPQEGHVRTVTTVAGQPVLVALTNKSLVLIDLADGRVARTLQGFGEPYFLVEPAPSSSLH